MISLDKKILDERSAVARRMVEYGKTEELWIVIPDTSEREVVLSPSVRAYGTGGASKLSQYLRLKKKSLALVKKHDIKNITVQDPSFLGNIGRSLKKKTGAALEIQLHGDFYGSDFYKRNLKDRIGYFFFGKRNIRSADRVRVVGDRVKKSVLGLGIPESKIRVQPVSLLDTGRLGIKEERDVMREFFGHEKYFLFLGRFEEVKNARWLIEIFDRIVKEYGRDFFLLIIGEGTQKNALRELVEKKGLEENIKFKGSTTDPRQYYGAVDCVLVPSQSEGYGLVPMEAHAAGTPVIMTDVGVANHELKPGPNVIIVPVNDREAFLQAILSV